MPNPTLINKKAIEFYKIAGKKFPQYDFSMFVYTGCRNKSVIICNEHGPFLAHPSSVLNSKANLCPECRKEKRRISPECFLEKARNIHGNLYTYNKKSVIESSWHDKIKIKCKKHGWFEQSKGAHLSGNGCQKCYEEQRENKAKFGIKKYYKSNLRDREKEFIKKAISKFGDRYDYSKALYVNSYTKIIIICPDHGEFEQTPFRHLQSNTGCIFCGQENKNFNYVEMYENTASGKEIGIFYKLLFTHKKSGIKFIKIGITKNTIQERYSRGYDEYEYEIIEQIQDTNYNCAVLEQTYKCENSDNRFYLPITWKFNGRSECYNYNKEQQLKSTNIQDIRNSLLQKQNGVCAICGKVPINPVLDHDHKKKLKGSTYCRGTICSMCNVFLAKCENNCIRYGISREELPEYLLSMSNYLQMNQTKLIHPSEAQKKKILTKSSYNKLVKAYQHHLVTVGKLPKLPEYRYNTKNKPVQGLTKPLENLFNIFKIEPEYYQ